MAKVGDFVNRRSVSFGVLVSVCLLSLFLAWNHWFIPLLEPVDDGKDFPFEISSHSVIFEIGSGSYISLKLKKELKQPADLSILLDDPEIIETGLNTITIQAGSTQNYFIPLHSKNVAGHCVLSFKSSSQELRHLYRVQIKIKVVHYIFLGYLSILLGWAYFFCWTVVYYPQIYQNFRRRSVDGFSFDYLSLNMTGHVCYLMFNISMYYNSHVQREYTKLHPKGELPVRINDVLFSIHAVTMNVIYVVQCCIYERGDQRVSTPILTLLLGLWITMGCGLIAAIVERTSWLQYLYYLSYIKVGTTPIKYTPQVYLHYVRKNTDGWSIHGVVLDYSGGMLSFLQMGLDAFNNDDWDGTLGNPGKLGLAIIAMVYDSIFMCQHFLLYAPNARRRHVSEQPEFQKKLLDLKNSFFPPKKTHTIYEL